MYDIIYVSTVVNRFKKFKKQFPIAKNASDFRHAQKISLTEFFWIVWDELEVLSDFKFDYVPDSGSKEYIHVFKNADEHNRGILLVPKNVKVFDKEIEYRFFVNKKELDIVASKTRNYDIIYVSQNSKRCEEFRQRFPEARFASSFREAQQINYDNFFYIVYDDILVTQDFQFNYFPDAGSKEYIHVFKNDRMYNGVALVPKGSIVTDKEIDFRFFVKKKELDIKASIPRPFDIVFISYNEENANENYSRLISRFPYAKRVHGVKGIHQAHIEAAKLCTTDMFWIVDGDAVIVDGFDFDHKVERWDLTTVHVWRSINPVNDLIYGYGGVKLFPRELTINMDTSKPDMTTSITDRFKAIDQISNITAFNTSPFNTWKSAFRECCKLSSRVIDRQKEEETSNRLIAWTTVGTDKLYGEYAIAGAKSGAAYGARNRDNIEELSKINDFDWLKEQFNNANI